MGRTDAGPERSGTVRGGLGVTAVLAALVVAALGARYGGDSGPGRADVRVRGLTDGAGPAWRAFAGGVDFLGEPAGAAALVLGTVAGCLLLRRPRAAVLVVAGTGAAVAATTLLKPVVGRTIHGGHLAFPSGHTGFLTAYALVVALLVTGRLGLGRTAGPSLVLAAGAAAGAVMGWAQIVLDAHYPTDVVGGWSTALAVVPATAWAVDRVAGTGPRAGR
ncbi:MULTISPECIES: phosphatase PAP2 family protein [unclassified Streptomyces]|uniref:phosphatase PAP2 family protein n=1 Tax=unclassified Streptomyces TaxID=2593676 RepID=UPI00370161C7